MAADFKVRLKGPNGEVVFEASAPLSETRQANYDGYGIVHLPTALISYKNTSSRTWTIAGKLVSRTPEEATANVRYLDLVRSWLLPDFGDTGATPPILTLYGYRNTNINGRRVVLKSYDWSFGEETDYVYTGSQPMPVIGLLNCTVEEVYSAAEVTGKAWKMTIGGAGKFAPGSEKRTNSFEISLGYGRTDPLTTRVSSSAAGSSVMSALGGSQPTIPGVVAGTIARTLGTTALNSPAVRAVTSNLPPVIGNILVSGGNVAIAEVGRTVTTAVSSVTPSPSGSSFGRSEPLPATPPIQG